MSTGRLGLLWPQTSAVWTAGTLYFENLLKSLALAGHADEVVVIEPEDGSFGTGPRAGLPKVERVAFPRAASSGSRAAVATELVRRQLGVPDPAVAGAVSRSGVDVVFGDVDTKTRFPVPRVGWIPDFQHVHYPEHFGPEAAARDRIYGRLAAKSTRVLLSSQDAMKDFEAFAPDHASKGRVAPFVSLLPESVFQTDPQATVAKYGVTTPFVVVPNQWWRHKNHEAAIRAAAILRDRGANVRWVMTGGLSDYRDPAHISALLQLIAELRLTTTVTVLGVLARDEQLQLMRAAEAIVQPSLFEGWSTVVEDVKTLGQRMVVSDLAVHREQRPPASLFFDPASPEDLADKVARMLDGACERPDESAARAKSLDRAAVFGETFHGICREAAGSR